MKSVITVDSAAVERAAEQLAVAAMSARGYDGLRLYMPVDPEAARNAVLIAIQIATGYGAIPSDQAFIGVAAKHSPDSPVFNRIWPREDVPVNAAPSPSNTSPA